MAHLTIPSVANEVEYLVSAVASSGPFTIPFAFFKDEDVKVSVNDGTATTELVLTTDYTVDGTPIEGGFTGGTITLVVARASVTVRVYRDTVIERLTEFPITGPFDIGALNDELNKVIVIEQELRTMRNKFISIPDSSIATDPYTASNRALNDLAEVDAAASAVTNRQLDASGPNGVGDDDLETGPLTINQWNTLITVSLIVIEGKITATTKTFDLITQYFTILQNRAATNAEVYLRYRYIVDCYSEITKQQNPLYRIAIGPTSSIPLPFMDVAQNIDYFNGDGTIQVSIDLYPNGSGSDNLFTEWNNIIVTTMQPR